MMKKELSKALNEQMVYEMYSAYIYLALAAEMEQLKLPGMAHWLRVQVDEELIHANLYYTYLVNQGEEVKLDAIPKPELKVKTPLDIFKAALAHEQKVTARINAQMGLAIGTGHYATMAFLNFFVTEQVEEEKSVRDIIDKLERAGADDKALLFIDAELMGRSAAATPAGAPSSALA